MAESIFSSFKISGEGMSVQRKRLSAVANNIANANTTKGPDGEPYQRDVVTVRAVPSSHFESELKSRIELEKTSPEQISTAQFPANYYKEANVLDANTVKDTTPPRLVYDPSHPDADEDGYVKMPNINIVTEMVEMISAQRAFEANTGVLDAAKNMSRDALDI
jgi:flagellar basal-body rod protein FlgC